MDWGNPPVFSITQMKKADKVAQLRMSQWSWTLQSGRTHACAWKNSPLATDLVSPLPATWKTRRQEVNEPAKMQKDFHLHLAHGFLRLSHPLLLSSLTSQYSTLPNDNSLTTTFPVQGPFFFYISTDHHRPPAPLLTCRPQPLACAVATACGNTRLPDKKEKTVCRKMSGYGGYPALFPTSAKQSLNLHTDIR